MIFFVAFCLFLEVASAVNYGQELPNSYSPLLRTRRQTDEANHCSYVTTRAYCSTSYVQNFINVIRTCGDEAILAINIFVSSCHKNEQGLFCGEAWDYVSGNCTSSTCTVGCSNSLRLAGCCGDDGTTTNCNIPSPSPCNLRIPSVVQDRLY